ncbi:DUF551 domain-containing protein [Pseudomonas soli]|jgi:hypothetical protein|uniref:DUF551 domain-containing protein n=1 Tax=Pseudomonas soli TaxID=1306993 RepID=UPI001E2BBBFB|nr:DUF551 domain-containing protein [Pseudomonas soli]WJO23191.1 DUF551 domain-containing protein [Pseudomonas soli]
MTIDLTNLKALATAAAANQYDGVTLNDYGTAVAPATVLGLIAEIERHRLVNTEGCKPESSILLAGLPCAGAASCRSLDKAEGEQPDLNTSPAQATVPPARREIKKAEDESAKRNESSSQWIKCTERLPGAELDGMAVIVTITDPKGRRISDCAVWNKGSRSRKGHFEFWGNKVIEWQPLPAPARRQP